MYKQPKERHIHHIYASIGGPSPVVEAELHYIEGNKAPYFAVTRISRGCDHEYIAEKFPELRPLIALHLCDPDGAPMHSGENGFYFYAEGAKDNREPVYFPTEEAREQEQKRRERAAYEAFKEESELCHDTASDIWLSTNTRNAYNSNWFAMAQRHKQSIRTTVTSLVVQRNNKALAKHLRISLPEAEAIPAGLTKAEFIAQHVEPHRERWREEAAAAIQWLKEKEVINPPMPDDAEDEDEKVYYFGAEAYKALKPVIGQQYTEIYEYRAMCRRMRNQQG